MSRSRRDRLSTRGFREGELPRLHSGVLMSIITAQQREAVAPGESCDFRALARARNLARKAAFSRMRRRNWPPAERPLISPTAARSIALPYGLRPSQSRFLSGPRPQFPHFPSLRRPLLPRRLRPRLRRRPPGRGRLLRGPAQKEEARPGSAGGRAGAMDLFVILLAIGAAVGFDLFLLVAGWMHQSNFGGNFGD